MFVLAVQPYVHRVQATVAVPLHQYEFDALVSFAYNPGGGWHAVLHAVNRRDYVGAVRELSCQVYSGGELVTGLINRRRYESDLFLFGIYG